MFVFSFEHKSRRAIVCVCVSQYECVVVCLSLESRQLNHFFFFLLPLSLWGNQAGLIFEAEKQYFIESRGQCEDEENMVRD